MRRQCVDKCNASNVRRPWSHTNTPVLVMVDFYVMDETHTLASMLRERLERNHLDEFVACVQMHPQDNFIRVTAPSSAAVRVALLELTEQVAQTRVQLEATVPHPPASKSSAAPVESMDESGPAPVVRTGGVPRASR